MAIRRGDIYFVNLSPVEGREQHGDRPVLVLSIGIVLVCSPRVAE
jgi:mRNA interferase MazF